MSSNRIALSSTFRNYNGEPNNKAMYLSNKCSHHFITTNIYLVQYSNSDDTQMHYGDQFVPLAIKMYHFIATKAQTVVEFVLYVFKITITKA